MSNWGDCSNRAYMEKMIEAAAKHPPNESKKWRIIRSTLLRPTGTARH